MELAKVLGIIGIVSAAALLFGIPLAKDMAVGYFAHVPGRARQIGAWFHNTFAVSMAVSGGSSSVTKDCYGDICTKHPLGCKGCSSVDPDTCGSNAGWYCSGNGECDPPSCPSGYVDEGVDCEITACNNIQDEGEPCATNVMCEIYECDIQQKHCVRTCREKVECSCGSWTDQGCGTGRCSPSEMYQTRSCSPSGCKSESRCKTSSKCEMPEVAISIDMIKYVLSALGLY